MFYALATALILSRTYAVIWQLPMIFEEWVFAILYPLTAKAALGFNQAWVITELCISINHSNKLLQDPGSQRAYPRVLIHRARIFLTAFLASFALASAVMYVAATKRMSLD